MLKCAEELAIGNIHIGIVGLFVLVGLFATSDVCAGAQTKSREEIRRFSDVRSQLVMAETTEERWDGILALEKFRSEFPQTFLKGDVTAELFHSYSMVVDHPGFLVRLAEKAIALQPNRNGLYKLVVKTFIDKEILPQRTLIFAQKSLEIAENIQASAGEYYQREVIERLGLLSQAYQMANRPERALEVMRRRLKQAENLSVTAFPDEATRQKRIDGIGLDLLRLYIDQRRWDSAYVLACNLLKNSVIREPVYELWSRAYVGKFGSAEGVISTYADLKAEIEESRKTRVIEERVKRPAPAFALRTLKDEPVNLNGLKGKVVVLNFWANWCGPCLDELPGLETLQRNLGQKSVEFLAVNLDTQDEEKRKYMISGTKARSAPSLTYLMGNEEIQREFGFDSIPYTCIVDREGYIRYEKTGLSSDFKATMNDQLTWVIGLSKQE